MLGQGITTLIHQNCSSNSNGASGNKVIRGPKALDFYTAFAKQQSSMRLAGYKLAT